MRTTSIDVLRGIAIMGILFMNIPFHSHILLGYVPFEPSLDTDKLISVIYSIFADGRFRTLFSILFGAGLAIQYESCLRKNIDIKIFLKSRLNWLLLFGFIHGVFVFGGDILMLYSVAGLLFIKGLSLETDVQLKKAIKFLIIGCLLALLFALMTLFFADMDERVVRGSESYLESMALWQGNYWYQTMLQAGFSLGLLIISPIFILWQVLGLMYLGSYLYRINFFRVGFSQATFAKITSLAIGTTLLCVLPQLLIDNVGLEVIPLLSSISAVFVALVYAHIIVKMCHSPGRLLNYLIAPGKVAFSLYILQSITMGLLLRWIMPSFTLEATMLDYFLIVCVYTIIQIVLANLYLQQFKQGPLEWLWRRAYLGSVERKLKAGAKVDSSLNE
jgi:uncharacterized protein